ncbi:hypothetical protein ACTFIU_002861 [Dictyostelium citrinum]
MVQEKIRGAWIYFLEGMWMYLKSIPFLVFFSMMIAILFRIATGILAWIFNTKAPHLNKIVCIVYGWSVQFFAMEFFFIVLLLMKLAVVYMDKHVHFERVATVDRIIIGNVIMSLVFYTTIGVIVLVDGSYSKVIDTTWRLYFICSAALITGSLGFFGFKILKQVYHNKNRTQHDEMLVTKVKGLIGVTSFLGIVLWVINIIYVTIGRDSDAEDWINIGFFALELINCYAALIIFGRSETCRKIRLLLGYPESMVGSDSSKGSSSGSSNGGGGGNELALSVTHISTHYSNTMDVQISNLDSNNISVSNSSVDV